ncbi:glycerol-3-phosphate 1-O-acyltransferase PlsY [Parvibaculum sedimenti]|uniref:Glycerol-3-phosphate acyltransferase n=1 Tax=Parvibaculum sedimenti TaxID=2608632 RepID=A0A6N6VIF3_9HYPH|nr:glycerol-3-phosphate 1-O-acyltransferase PlsY [Parvibaculum sedimenti]KAB7740190.1 glycerol-3-phosphate 1-O-acyltransferase PlsY [Parvibaculum sedimenti]
MIEALNTAAPWVLAALAVGYLLGSIPFGLIFTRMAGLGDIRDIGSGNIGATNALRTGNKWVAGATFLCDAGKGAAAVLLARQFAPEAIAPALSLFAGAGAVVGHLFPIWLKFKGGKGFSTFIGINLALYWPVVLLFGATWLLIAVIFRYSSLATLVAVALTPAYLFLLGQNSILPLSIFLAILIFVAHRGNIGRLLSGTESRIGSKKS